MSIPLPHGAPATLNEAFGYINAVTAPTIDDLKVMVLVEAAGKALYEHMAASLSDARVQDLLLHNGREELAHAHRVSKAISAISGVAYPPPMPTENPYLNNGPMAPMSVTADSLTKLAEAEFGGDALYERWASHTQNAEAAELMRQNGREESQHGNRLLEAAKLIAA